MSNTYNTGVYPQEWMTKLQERLDYPTNWKEVCDVIYSDTQVFNVPYMSTTPSVQNGTRGTAYTMQDYALTNEALTIGTYRVIPMQIDRADLAQCSLVGQMELADLQGQLLNEKLEAAFLGDHASLTNFGDTGGGVLGLASTAITVTANNIENVILGVKEQIITANGLDMMDRHGAFFIWRAADFTALTQFAAANGFSVADAVLKSGIQNTKGFEYLGAYHYVSNSHTAGHVIAGVRKLYKIGILKSTYGQIVITRDPLNISAEGVVSRLDYGTLVPTKYLPILFDVNVS